MRPLVIGTGVAGTVAALALHEVGFKPKLFEAYEQSAGLVHGVYLTVAVNGIAALRAVGADHVVLDNGFDSPAIEFFSGSGKHLGTIPLGPPRPDGTGTRTIRRADLYNGLLAEAERRGIPVHRGKRLTGLRRPVGGGVVAEFADGSTAEGDVLVGADGVHSVTRTLIDPRNPAPTYTGLGNTGGFVPADAAKAVPGLADSPFGTARAYTMVWGKRCFFGSTISPDGEIWWFANPPSAQPLPRGGETDGRARIVELLRGDANPASAIVAAAPEPVRVTNQYELARVPTWQDGAAVVIGDAAHAVSPSSGQGASMAAEDAVVLARCLRAAPSVAAGLAAYERERRARVERIVSWGAGMNNTKRTGLVAWALREFALPLMLRKSTSERSVAEMAWLFDHRVALH
jgi:FAD-dependent urate hydroxylase